MLILLLLLFIRSTLTLIHREIVLKKKLKNLYIIVCYVPFQNLSNSGIGQSEDLSQSNSRMGPSGMYPKPECVSESPS